MLTSKNSGLSYITVIILLLSLGLALPCYPQGLDGRPGNNYHRDKNKLAEDYEAGKRNFIAMSVKNIPLKEALEIICDKADLVLSYRSGLFQPYGIVSLNTDDGEVNRTIEDVLDGTELRYKITETGHLVVYEEKKMGNIKGDVFDAYTDEPLQGAKVLLVDADEISGPGVNQDITSSTYVASTGRYDINNVEAGTYRLIVVDEGYKKIYKKVEIKDKKTTVENFRLEYPRK